MNINAHCACALTHKGDSVRISSESGYIVNYPSDCGGLIVKPEISANAVFIGQLGVSTEAERSETVINRYGYDIGTEAVASDMPLIRASAREASAVNKNQNRCFIRIFRSKDIQKQAILAVCKA